MATGMSIKKLFRLVRTHHRIQGDTLLIAVEEAERELADLELALDCFTRAAAARSAEDDNAEIPTGQVSE